MKFTQGRKRDYVLINCDEMYKPDHRYQSTRVFMIIGEDGCEEEPVLVEQQQEVQTDAQNQDMQISIHALNGSTSDTIVRIKATIGNKEVIILINTIVAPTIFYTPRLLSSFIILEKLINLCRCVWSMVLK